MKKTLIAVSLSLLAVSQLQAQGGGAMAERQQARVQELIEILEVTPEQEAGFREAMAQVQAMQRETVQERAAQGNRGGVSEQARERAQQQRERGQQRGQQGGSEQRGNMRDRMADMTAEERAERREQMQAQLETRSRMLERQDEIDAILGAVLNDEQLSRFRNEQARMAQQQAQQMRERAGQRGERRQQD